MADQLRAAAEQALEAWDTRAGIDAASRAFEALRAALAQAEPVQDFRLTECVFVGPPPAPHEDWHHAISAMLREKHISGLRISTATADDWNGDKEQQRKPLTGEEIDNCWYQSGGLSLGFARAIEAAHGIKGAK